MREGEGGSEGEGEREGGREGEREGMGGDRDIRLSTFIGIDKNMQSDMNSCEIVHSEKVHSSLISAYLF